jgi:glycerate kinase
MKTLIAFDSFKDALSAAEACKIAADCIRQEKPNALQILAPITDGGEGFASILADALNGTLHHVAIPGPRFTEVEGRFALVPYDHIPDAARKRLNLPASVAGKPLGIVEMASASGLESVAPADRDPWQASSFGTGRLMQKAVEAGAGAILLGIGGSATNDVGAGALEALGVCFYDRELQAVTKVTPDSFKQINTVGSTSHLIDAFPPVRIACDVTNPLTGAQGATRVFGPQKGLKEEDFARFERAVHKMGCRILGLFGHPPSEWQRLLAEPGAGAAGGTGFALLHALPDSQFVEGAPLVVDLLELPHKVNETDLLITGEGRLDRSSLFGKGPVALLRLLPETTRCLLFVGSADAAVVNELTKAHSNLRIISISDPAWPLEKALAQSQQTLTEAVSIALNNL